MSERLKETGCKPVGSAFAGSNPAPPTIRMLRFRGIRIHGLRRVGENSRPAAATSVWCPRHPAVSQPEVAAMRCLGVDGRPNGGHTGMVHGYLPSGSRTSGGSAERDCETVRNTARTLECCPFRATRRTSDEREFASWEPRRQLGMSLVPANSIDPRSSGNEPSPVVDQALGHFRPTIPRGGLVSPRAHCEGSEQ